VPLGTGDFNCKNPQSLTAYLTNARYCSTIKDVIKGGFYAE